MRKVLQDEADLVGAFVVNEFGTVLERLLLLAEPVVRRLDEIAGTRDNDIPVFDEWVARGVLTLVGDLPTVHPREILRDVLRTLVVATDRRHRASDSRRTSPPTLAQPKPD